MSHFKKKQESITLTENIGENIIEIGQKMYFKYFAKILRDFGTHNICKQLFRAFTTRIHKEMISIKTQAKCHANVSRLDAMYSHINTMHQFVTK